MYSRLADLVVIVHFAFVLFVVFGGFVVLRWPRAAWVHLPVAVWGVLIEYLGFLCPLTPLEQWLRERAGQEAYQGAFVDRYILPLLYPIGLSRANQWVLGSIVLAINLAIYVVVVRRHRRRRALSS